MRAPVEIQAATYRGFPVVVAKYDFCVHAPDGDLAYFASMSSVRRWVRAKRKQLGLPGGG